MIHPVDYEPSQDFGDNPTAHLPASHWIIKQFGNYQPDGHTGIDYPCPVGTPVKAVAAGIVRHVGRLSGTYAANPWWIAPSFAGFVYVVDHGHFIGIYGHCMEGGARVVANQRVTEGQILGLSGNTGASTGPHLHFEVLPDGYVLNSVMYGRIDPGSLFIGSLTPAGTTITPITQAEEDDMFTDEDRAVINSANIRAEVAMNEATNAKLAAQAALQSVASLLQTKLPDPANAGGYQPSLAEWIVYGNLKAGGAQQVASALTPEVIASAVAKASSEVDAQALADRLTITVKES